MTNPGGPCGPVIRMISWVLFKFLIKKQCVLKNSECIGKMKYF